MYFKYTCLFPTENEAFLLFSPFIYSLWVLKRSKYCFTNQIKRSLEERTWEWQHSCRKQGSWGAIFLPLHKWKRQFYPSWLDAGNTWRCQMLAITLSALTIHTFLPMYFQLSCPEVVCNKLYVSICNYLIAPENCLLNDRRKFHLHSISDVKSANPP